MLHIRGKLKHTLDIYKNLITLTHMSNIYFVTEVAVYLEGRKVGAIKEITLDGCYGNPYYRYFPKGDSLGGESFKTLAECKASLKG